MNVFGNGKKFIKHQYPLEDNFETDIFDNSKSFFGPKTILIDAKKKIQSKSLGGTIPDGFFFDLSDPNDPQFYLVEVELAKHSFFSHIFPQITKFFAFYKNHKQQKSLIESLFGIIEKDKGLKNEFKKLIGNQEIYKFISDLLDNSQNILLIIDGEKKELPEIIDTYTDTWGRMVKPLIIQKFVSNGEYIFTMDPEYEALEYIEEEPTESASEIAESFHLEGVSDLVKSIYEKIKSTANGIDNELIFNPQKYYISIKSSKNIAFIKIRKKKIRLIVMLPEDDIRSFIGSHPVKALSAGVQGFYNGPCAAIDVENLKSFKEIEKVISSANERSKNPLTTGQSGVR